MSSQTVTDCSAPVDEYYLAPEAYAQPQATLGQMAFMFLTILSFAYERPLLELTDMNRTQPRVFDFFWIWAVVLLLRGVPMLVPVPRFLRIWKWIVAVFVFCAVIWQIWIPFDYGRYSLFFAIKYLQGLVVLVVFCRIPLSEQQKQKLMVAMIIGGLIVAVYAIPEYASGGSTGEVEVVARADKVIVTIKGALFSCLSNTYFHVAMYCSMASIMTLAFYESFRSFPKRLACLLLSLFLAWPAFFCGARIGIAATLLGWTSMFLQSRRGLKGALVVTALLLFMMVVFWKPSLASPEKWMEESVSFRRLFEAEERGKLGSAIGSRLSLDFYDIQYYEWQGWRIPFIGAGFYVAPQMRGNALHYRVGYGVHNSYLFSLEQGGLGALILFIVFLIVLLRSLKNTVRYAGNQTDIAMAKGARAFLHALLIVMLPGQVFWYGFGSINFNAYIMVVFLLAMKRTSYDSLYYVDPAEYRKAVRRGGV